MQPHEGPPPQHKPDEAGRQRVLTRNLLLAIGVLMGALCVLLAKRQFT